MSSVLLLVQCSNLAGAGKITQQITMAGTLCFPRSLAQNNQSINKIWSSPLDSANMILLEVSRRERLLTSPYDSSGNSRITLSYTVLSPKRHSSQLPVSLLTHGLTSPKALIFRCLLCGFRWCQVSYVHSRTQDVDPTFHEHPLLG